MLFRSFRCTCPSRQFPCKHSLALLYEMMAGKPFAVCAIPEDILQKRAKKAAKAAKGEENAGAEAVPKAPPKVNRAARAKKLQRQLEGLDLTAKLVRDLMDAGLGTMGGTALATYRDLAKPVSYTHLPRRGTVPAPHGRLRRRRRRGRSSPGWSGRSPG